MTRHVLTHEERVRGGKNQPRESKVLGGQRGFEATCILHPFFARHWLQYMPGMRRSPQYKNAVVRQNMRQSSTMGRRKPL